ncbi:NYN domain-containing protein [Paeniglutamicibacter psychrophenolicus]|uniref:NYN domain-containing protein n=1 Tax=Paeniglutamicibacter psychrophenolicus TaxID=257454 RepID=A0ABS4WIJ8_9MICC|nr:NYN domain-containing protein [Paeniglutamicibacter psychrophenolicus]MBP2376032.1 hypothetical protein [Paeniglutamicibacter psychrophenolicus]
MGDARRTRRNVAVFLDMENLVGGTPTGASGLKLGELVWGIENLVWESGMGSCSAMVRAYAHWGRPVMAGFQREILEHGVEPVQIFSFDKNIKNAADIELCVDVLSVAYESPWIDVFVIATGDGGFVPLVRRLHAMNKYVIVVSTNAPRSGGVNALLRSVADEYHQIQMSQESMTDPRQPMNEDPPVNTPSAKEHSNIAETAKQKQCASKPNEKNAQPASTVQQTKIDAVSELRRAILAIIKQTPELVVAHRVNAAALGSKLRSEYPQLSYKACGSKTLSDFLNTYCALGVIKPVAAQTPGPSDVLPSSARIPTPTTTEPALVPTPRFFLEAVRKEFTTGTLGHRVRARGTAGMKLSDVGTQLRIAITGFTSPNAGFPYLHQVLDQALDATEYCVIRSEVGSTTVVHSSQS